jgi:uncharacterized protein YcbK (DUF882 family)
MKNRNSSRLIASIFVAVFISLLMVTSTDNRSARERYIDAQEKILMFEATASRQHQIRDHVGYQYSKDSLRVLEELSRNSRNQHNTQLLRELWKSLSVTGDKELFLTTYNERRL